MKIESRIIAALLLLSNLLQGQSQSISDYLDAYLDENAVPYVQPLVDLVTSNMNTGIWEWSRDDGKIYFRLKAQAVVTYPTESMRTFSGHTTGDFKPPQIVEAPTVIGDEKEIFLIGSDTTYYLFPGGYNLTKLMLGTPQATIGGFLHSEVSGRYLSFNSPHDLGKVTVIGFGARHFLTDYFKNPPFDFSIGYFYHQITSGDYLDSKQNLYSASIGKSGKYISGQVMVGYQTSATAMHYTYMDDLEPYDVNLFLKNQNKWVTEASLGLRLGPIFAYGAVNYAKILPAFHWVVDFLSDDPMAQMT